MTDKCCVQTLHRVCDLKASCTAGENIHAHDAYDTITSCIMRQHTGRCTVAIPVQKHFDQCWVLYIPCIVGTLAPIMSCAMINLAMAVES